MSILRKIKRLFQASPQTSQSDYAGLWTVARQIVRGELGPSRLEPDGEAASEIMARFRLAETENQTLDDGPTDDCYRAASYILDNYDVEKSLCIMLGLARDNTAGGASQLLQALLKIDKYLQSSGRAISEEKLHEVARLICFTMSFLPLDYVRYFRERASPIVGTVVDDMLRQAFPKSLEALKGE